jgi:hypothetical protein
VANREHFEVWAGEDRTLTMHARDSANAPQNLSGLTLTCRVGRPPNVPWQDSAVFNPTTSVVSASAGTFSAVIDGGDTVGLHGEYMHQTTDQNGVVLTEGRLLIKRAIMA